MRELRKLSWKDFCENLSKDEPPPEQTRAEEFFFSKIAPDALNLFFEKVSEIVQLFELSLYASQIRSIALQKTNELFDEDIPFYETMLPIIRRHGLSGNENFLEVCAYLKLFRA